MRNIACNIFQFILPHHTKPPTASWSKFCFRILRTLTPNTSKIVARHLPRHGELMKISADAKIKDFAAAKSSLVFFTETKKIKYKSVHASPTRFFMFRCTAGNIVVIRFQKSVTPPSQAVRNIACNIFQFMLPHHTKPPAASWSKFCCRNLRALTKVIFMKGRFPLTRKSSLFFVNRQRKIKSLCSPRREGTACSKRS